MTQPTAPERRIRPDWKEHYGTEYLCVGPFVWGRGATVEIAVANAKKGLRGSVSQPIRKAVFITYLVPKGSRVTEMGDIEHPGDAPMEKVEERQGSKRVVFVRE